MSRNTQLVTISLMPGMLREADQLAKKENRTRSELLREALRQYILKEELRQMQSYGMRKAKGMGLKAKDVERLIDEYRDEQIKATRTRRSN